MLIEKKLLAFELFLEHLRVQFKYMCSCTVGNSLFFSNNMRITVGIKVDFKTFQTVQTGKPM